MLSTIVLEDEIGVDQTGRLIPELQVKYERLQSILRQMKRVLVAYSGGIDSTLVTKVALDTLGPENLLAVIGISASLGQDEEHEALALLEEMEAPYLTLFTDEVEDPRYAANPANRCYYCKTHLYDSLQQVAQERQFDVIADGFNADDVGDYRPGRQAGREHSVRSPLHEADMNKAEIRGLARYLGLSNWAKPAAACLSSRVEYGTQITSEVLRQIDQAERALHRMGFRELRVRHHDKLARIEVKEDLLPVVLTRREEIVQAVKGAGYIYVTLDLQGLRRGSMNEALINRG